MLKLKQTIALMSPITRSHRVGVRLAAYVLLFALLVSVLLTGLQLWQAHEQETDRIEQLLEQQASSSEHHLADVVWEDDQQHALQVAENLVKLSDVSYVRVRSNDRVLAETGTLAPNMRTRTMVLAMRHGAKTSEAFGDVTLGVNMDLIEQRQWQGAAGILWRTTLLIGLTVGFVLFLFQFMVTRHLSRISQFFSTLTPQTLTQPLQLDRSPLRSSGGDEFDDLVKGVNHMQAALASDLERREKAEWEVRQLNEVLEKRVAERTHELLEKNQQLLQLAVTDSLTGLYNRLKLDQVLTDELKRSRRYGSVFALILLDVDHFKSVNDNFGHAVGDQVLVEMGRLLTQGTRNVDVVGRWGGEEFLVICCDTEFKGAEALAEKLRLAIEGHTFPVVGHKTASFGVSSIRSGDTIPVMMARTDSALYRSKSGGRNRVETNI